MERAAGSRSATRRAPSPRRPGATRRIRRPRRSAAAPSLSCRSAASRTGVPSSSVTRSPGLSPSRSAADCGSTWRTTAPGGGTLYGRWFPGFARRIRSRGVRRLAGGMARVYQYQAGPNLSSLAARPAERSSSSGDIDMFGAAGDIKIAGLTAAVSVAVMRRPAPGQRFDLWRSTPRAKVHRGGRRARGSRACSERRPDMTGDRRREASQSRCRRRRRLSDEREQYCTEPIP